MSRAADRRSRPRLRSSRRRGRASDARVAMRNAARDAANIGCARCYLGACAPRHSRSSTRAASALLARSLGAQSNFARPALDWMTVRTRYFDVHYPASMTEWTLDLTTPTRCGARRGVGARGIFAAPSHHADHRRSGQSVERLRERAARRSAHRALADAARPVGACSATYRDWPELLVGPRVRAHRAPRVAPRGIRASDDSGDCCRLRVGPVALRTPRWAVEGYATYVEGRLTGSGRPHGAARAAYLRQWALEGKLPTYAQLSSGGEFAAGAMAYLAGSAFLEWLVAQRGDSSLVAVWRRLSARQPRSFAQAFAGVYGAPPDELYGRFTVDAHAARAGGSRHAGRGGARHRCARAATTLGDRRAGGFR